MSDRSRPLGMIDFKTHPYYANYVGYKRSISQEPAPAYLKLRHEDVEGGGDNTAITDLMRMSPERIAEYIQFIGQTNPDIAAQISTALGNSNPVPAGRQLSQAPPGA
jgi:hypothetical protein